jgi:ribosome assembly protein YihI (activator of Der GTPase)
MYDANTAAMEMWHRAQEQLQQSEYDKAEQLAVRMGTVADKLDLLITHLDQGSPTMLDSLHFVEGKLEKIEEAMNALWEMNNA